MNKSNIYSFDYNVISLSREINANYLIIFILNIINKFNIPNGK